MKNELQKVTKEWMSLERKTLQQRKKAEQFYDENMMRLIEGVFIETNREKVTDTVDYLIVSVGTSYEPLVLSIQLFRPKHILILYTDVSETVLNKIAVYCGLGASDFQKCRVHETNPIDIYREIKQAYLRWGRPEKLYIDFTGGTKSMSAAAAMAGAMIDVQMVYVGTEDYLVDFRKPYPVSETLYFIDNPLTIFGDLEVEKAMVLFDRANFSGAKEKLAVLKEQIPDPNLRQQLNFLYLLAGMYEHWDALEFPEAYEAARKLERELKRDSRIHPVFILMDCIGRVERQRLILESLKGIPGLLLEKKSFEILKDPKVIVPLMFTMYTNALLRAEQEKYDMATLLMYRLLEMIEQRRLAGYNLYVSCMVYENIVFMAEDQREMNSLPGEAKREWLKSAIFEVKKQLFPRTDSRYLPEQISLLEGFILLSVLEDGILTAQRGSVLQRLRRIRSMVYLRNNSIFAHGLGPVPREDYQKFRAFVEELFRHFCQLEGVDFEAGLMDVTWINPTQTKYYSRLEV